MIKKTLLLTMFLASMAIAQDACSANQFYYNFQCVDLQCIHRDLESLILVKHRTPQLDNVGEFNRGFHFSAQQSVDGAGNLAIKHIIRFQDDATNPLIKPDSCLDATIFMTYDDFEVNNQRKYTVAGSAKPSWPAEIRTNYQASTGERQYYFFLTLDDLETRCRRCPTDLNEKIMYQCYFEMAISLAGVDQASYYFASVITIDVHLNPNTLLVDWIKIIEVDRCIAGTECEVTIRVNSELNFCCDLECTERQRTPFGLLWINKPFFIEHRLTDAAFAQWFVKVKQTVFTAAGFKLYLQPLQIAERAGATAMKFNTPVAQRAVTIAVTSILQSPRDH